MYSAFKASTGEKLWESQTNWKYRNAIARKDRLIASERKVHQLLNENNDTSPDSWVSVIDLRTGKELWRSQEVPLGVFHHPGRRRWNGSGRKHALHLGCIADRGKAGSRGLVGVAHCSMTEPRRDIIGAWTTPLFI